jgi:ribosomal protein L40E
MGWKPNSSMAGTYVHLSGEDDIDDMMLDAANIKKEMQEPEKPMIYKCTECGVMNSITRKRCRSCGYSVEDKTALNYDELKDNYDSLKAQMEKLANDFYKTSTTGDYETWDFDDKGRPIKK